MKRVIALCIVSFSVFVSVFFSGCSFMQNLYNDYYTETRDARNSDISNFNCVITSSRNATISFIVKTDIEDLRVKVVATGNDKTILDSMIKDMGDVIEGQQYIIEYVLPDNGITVNKKIDTIEFSVFSGTVSYYNGPGIYVQ